jgi:hypothetical protein
MQGAGNTTLSFKSVSRKELKKKQLEAQEKQDQPLPSQQSSHPSNTQSSNNTGGIKFAIPANVVRYSADNTPESLGFLGLALIQNAQKISSLMCYDTTTQQQHFVIPIVDTFSYVVQPNCYLSFWDLQGQQYACQTQTEEALQALLLHLELSKFHFYNFKQSSGESASNDEKLLDKLFVTNLSHVDIQSQRIIKLGDMVRVKYTAHLLSTTQQCASTNIDLAAILGPIVLETSNDGKSMVLGQVGKDLAALHQGLDGAAKNVQRVFVAPASLCYGPKETTKIPPQSDLVFLCTIDKVKQAKESSSQVSINESVQAPEQVLTPHTESPQQQLQQPLPLPESSMSFELTDDEALKKQQLKQRMARLSAVHAGGPIPTTTVAATPILSPTTPESCYPSHNQEHIDPPIQVFPTASPQPITHASHAIQPTPILPLQSAQMSYHQQSSQQQQQQQHPTLQYTPSAMNLPQPQQQLHQQYQQHHHQQQQPQFLGSYHQQMPQTPSFGSPVAFSFDSNNRSPNNIAPIMNNNTNLTANSQQLLEHASNRIETLYVMLSNPVAPPQAIGIPEENQIKPENLAPLSGAHIVATFQHLIDQVGIQNNYIEKLKTQISQSRKANACGLGGGADDQEQIEELQQQIITIQKAYRGKNKEFNELLIKCNNLELEIENFSVKHSLASTPSHSQPPIDVTVSPEYISLLEKFNALQADQPKAQIEPDDEKTSELQTQLEFVSSQLKAAQSELIDIKSQVSILTEEKNQALSIQAQLESDQVQIKAELEQALATRLKPNEEIVSPITEPGNSITNEELDQALAKIEALGNKTASLQQQNDDLTAQITLSNDHLAVIKAEKDQFEEKYTSLNTNYELLRDQFTISQNESNVIKSQFEAYKAEYTTSNDSLDTMRLEIQEEMAAQAKIRQEKIITKAKERVSELNQQIEELTQQHESDVAQITEQARSRVEKLKTGALSLKNDYDVLNDEHLRCLHKHQELENEILAMRSKIDELESSESLKNINDSSIEDITHQHQLEMKSLQLECEHKISQIEAQTEKVIQDAQLNLDNILADNKVLIEQLNHDHYAQIEKLRDEMNTKQLQTEEVSDNRQEELSDIVDENQSLQSTIQMKNNHIDTLTEQIQAATTTLDEARIQIQHLESELKSSNTMICALQEQLTPVKPDQSLEASTSTPLESHIDDDIPPESDILFETEQELSRDAVQATDDYDDSNDNGDDSDNTEEEALVKENQHFEESSPSNPQELEEPDSTITIDVEIVEEDAVEASSEHISDLSVDPSLSSNGQNEPLNLSQTEQNDEITDEPVALQEEFTPQNKPLPIQATTNSSPFDLFGSGDDDHDDMLLGGVSNSPVPISSPSSPGIPKTTVPDFMNQSSLFGDDDDDDSGLFGATTSTSNTGKLSSTLSSSLFDDDLF